MRRRSFLAGAASALAAAGIAPSAIGTVAAQDDSTTDGGPVRGELDVDRSVEVEEDDEHVTFVDDDEVRFVMAWASSPPEDDEPPEREPIYETTSWEDWGELRARPAAAEAAAERVADELGLDRERVGHGISSSVSGDDAGAIVTVRQREDDPEIDVADVAAATPSSVHVTYRLEGRAFERDVPIYATVRGPIEADDFTGDVARDGPADGAANGTEPIDVGASSDDPASAENDSSNESDEDVVSDEEGGSDDEDDADALPGFGAVAALGALAASAMGYARRSESSRE